MVLETRNHLSPNHRNPSSQSKQGFGGSDRKPGRDEPGVERFKHSPISILTEDEV